MGEKSFYALITIYCATHGSVQIVCGSNSGVMISVGEMSASIFSNSVYGQTSNILLMGCLSAVWKIRAWVSKKTEAT